MTGMGGICITTSTPCPTLSPTPVTLWASIRSRGLWITSTPGRSSMRRWPEMRFGYWLPVFGGWLRNVDDEKMAATWDYVQRLARRSEQIGYDLTLVAEPNLNDIQGE